jgi:hypothetical protein
MAYFSLKNCYIINIYNKYIIQLYHILWDIFFWICE